MWSLYIGLTAFLTPAILGFALGGWGGGVFGIIFSALLLVAFARSLKVPRRPRPNGLPRRYRY
jgi:uncharacterized protein (DUF58 family)